MISGHLRSQPEPEPTAPNPSQKKYDTDFCIQKKKIKAPLGQKSQLRSTTIDPYRTYAYPSFVPQTVSLCYQNAMFSENFHLTERTPVKIA